MLGHRELAIDDYLEIFRRRYWILLLTAIIGSAGAYLVSRALPNEYESRTLVLVQQPKVDQRFVTPVVSEQVNERLESMREEILSTAQLQPVAEQFHLSVSKLRKSITVTPVQPIVQSPWAGIPGFTVHVMLNDPRLAQQVCRQITSMFLEQNARWRSQSAQDTTDFLSKQIDDAKHALDEQDAKLTAFKLQYLGKLPDEAQTNMNILASYNSQLEAATEALNRTQQDKVNLESQLAQQLAAWKATRSGSNALTLEEQLADLQNKLVMLQARYTNDYPDVIKTKSDIAHLQARINAAKATGTSETSTQRGANTPAYAEPPQIQQLRRQIHQYNDMIQERTKQQASLQKKIDEYQTRVQLSPLVEQKFTEMTRDYQTALEFYRNLLTKKAQADMGADLERRQQAEDFRVIDPATFSSLPTYPNRLLFAGGGAAGGLFLGIAIALWLEMRDKLIRTEQDVEFYLQAPTLALVPVVEKQSEPRKKYLPANLTGEGNSTAKTLGG
jgi:polysaccharide chain length determinant protein (PEP-CTERM system associated)